MIPIPSHLPLSRPSATRSISHPGAAAEVARRISPCAHSLRLLTSTPAGTRPPAPARILVLRGGAVGDFILTIPALALLRRRYPSARIELLGYPAIASLAEAEGLIDQVLPIEDPALAPLFVRDGQIPTKWRHLFAAQELALSFLYDPEGIVRGQWARCSPAPWIDGPHRPDESTDQHAIEALIEPLRACGIDDSPPWPCLPNLAAKPGSLPPGSWLAIHPGSGSPKKNWPEACWRQLIERLLQRGDLNLLIVGGEAESGRLEPLVAGLPPERFQLLDKRPLVEVARHLAACGGFVGHDSGITHLAAALGLPVLALWGPSNPNVWRPWGGRVQLLRHPGGIQSLTVAEVESAAIHH